MYQAIKSSILTFQFSFGSRCQSTSQIVGHSHDEAQKPANRRQKQINGAIEILSKDDSVIENKVVGDISTFDTTDENKPFSSNETYATRNIDKFGLLGEKQKEKYIIDKKMHTENHAIHTLPINKSGDDPISRGQQKTSSPLVINYCEQFDNFCSVNITNKKTPCVVKLDDSFEPLWIRTLKEDYSDTIVISIDPPVSINNETRAPYHAKPSDLNCQFCSKTFNTKKAVIQHEQNIHSVSGDWQCHKCHKNFSSFQYLRNHSKIHNEAPKYVCTEYGDCNKIFSSSKNLKRHIRGLHTGEKPYECRDCGKCFSASSNLSEHKTIHTGVMKYTCTNCNKKFRLSSTLRKHVSRNTCTRL